MQISSEVARVGVSACLLEQPTGVDGGPQRGTFLADAFGPSITWIPVSSEAEAGLATLDLDGFVLENHSPSSSAARELLARALGDAFPLLPVEEESRLREAGVRDH